MKILLLTPFIISFFSLPSHASLTLIYWYNKTGTGTDKPNYPNKNLRGRFKGEVIYKNDNDPCIYSQKNIQYKSKEIKRAVDKKCISKEENMKNPILRMGLPIPFDRRRLQADSVDPRCAIQKNVGKKGTEHSHFALSEVDQGRGFENKDEGDRNRGVHSPVTHPVKDTLK